MLGFAAVSLQEILTASFFHLLLLVKVVRYTT